MYFTLKKALEYLVFIVLFNYAEKYGIIKENFDSKLEHCKVASDKIMANILF